jgi:limonene 1,2-monooxygenase
MRSIALKHGVFLAPYHDIEDGPTTWLRRDIELCQFLDRLGFHEAWIGEHHSGGMEMISSPELFIAAAAEVTRHIRFGTGVISLPYHNPLMVANRIAQLDHMTQGRVSFGFGPGLLVSDAQMLGVDSERTRDMMLESLEVILRLLKGEVVSQKTDWFNLVGARAHLLPYSYPLPEIAVASAVTSSGGRAAGRLGLSMLCFAASTPGGFNSLDVNWETANEFAAEHGNRMDPANLRLVMPMHIAETREKARENVKFGIDRWNKYYSWVAVNPFEGSGDLLIDNLIESKRAVIGTPDDAIAMIKRFEEKQGEFGVILNQHCEWADWNETNKSFELYARFVMPHFSRSNANRLVSYEDMGRRANDLYATRKQASDNAMARFAAEDKAKSDIK